ncbi:MAG: YfhO family protein, partial [Anaerolineales bacterium]|nr:YfhO family protein [Anaerolineales bacterium]
ERGLERIFSLSYNIPQHIAAENSLQLADGVNPLQLESYITYMADAVGFSDNTYSVTLPPFPDGDPATPQTFLLDAKKLGYMNVAYVLSAYPINNSELTFVELIAGTYIYENPYLRPRAWLDGADPQSSSAWREVDEINWSPNEIVIHAEGPGLLILSEVDYPGWTVTVDGQQSTIERYQEVFRAVSLGAGAHLIKFTLRPRLVFIGGLLSILTMFGLAWVWLKR